MSDIQIDNLVFMVMVFGFFIIAACGIMFVDMIYFSFTKKSLLEKIDKFLLGSQK